MNSQDLGVFQPAAKKMSFHSNEAGAVIHVSTDVEVTPSSQTLLPERCSENQQHPLGEVNAEQTAEPSPSAPLPVLKPGYQTSEFWVTVTAQVVGILTAMGVVSPGHSSDFSNSINTIVGAVMSILPAVVYIFNRTWLKTKIETPQR